MPTFSGRSRHGHYLEEFACIKSKEAFHIGEKGSEPGDCEFKLEFMKKDDLDSYQLHKYTL